MASSLTSILVPVYNSTRFAQNLCNTITKHTRPEEYEIILIDNKSTEAEARLFFDGLNAPNIRVIHNESNLGFGKANNIGLKSSKGDYIALINSDMFVTADWLPHMINRFSLSKDCAAVQGKLILVDDNGPEAWQTQTCGATFNEQGMPSYRLGGIDPKSTEVNQSAELQAFMGTGVLLNRQVIEEVGFFDEEYDIVFLEDTDLSLRISEKGHRIYYEPLASFYHFLGASMPHLSKEQYESSISHNVSRFKGRWPQEKVTEIMTRQGLMKTDIEMNP